ncbi:MAG TPA: haloacid dehalogenase type II [Myxococcaceae bacterium]|nr:haloacid dehalogenase type II [Myxococcaceae bacterium]
MAFIGFDVYGTLVDPLGMDAPLREHVGDLAERFAATWRERQIDWTFRRALMGRYANFDVVTREAFRATAVMLGVDLQTAEVGLLDTYRRLPAFADAFEGLTQLAEAGHQLVAFSNGVGATLRGLLTHARLVPPLVDVVSVDEVRTYKPSPAVYQHLVARGGQTAEQTWLVSANAWDVLGAKSAGLKAAWVRRSPRAHWDGGGIAEPDLVVASLADLPARLRGV